MLGAMRGGACFRLPVNQRITRITSMSPDSTTSYRQPSPILFDIAVSYRWPHEDSVKRVHYRTAAANEPETLISLCPIYFDWA
jgi:hypothetical protein